MDSRKYILEKCKEDGVTYKDVISKYGYEKHRAMMMLKPINKTITVKKLSELCELVNCKVGIMDEKGKFKEVKS